MHLTAARALLRPHALLRPRALLHHPRGTLKDLTLAGHVITSTLYNMSLLRCSIASSCGDMLPYTAKSRLLF